MIYPNSIPGSHWALMHHTLKMGRNQHRNSCETGARTSGLRQLETRRQPLLWWPVQTWWGVRHSKNKGAASNRWRKLLSVKINGGKTLCLLPKWASQCAAGSCNLDFSRETKAVFLLCEHYDNVNSKRQQQRLSPGSKKTLTPPQEKRVGVAVAAAARGLVSQPRCCRDQLSSHLLQPRKSQTQSKERQTRIPALWNMITFDLVC